MTTVIGKLVVDGHQHRAVRKLSQFAVRRKTAAFLLKLMRSLAQLRLCPAFASIARSNDINTFSFPFRRHFGKLKPGGIVAVQDGIGQNDVSVAQLPKGRVTIITWAVDNSFRLGPGFATIFRNDNVEPAFLPDMRRAPAQNRHQVAIFQLDENREVTSSLHYIDVGKVGRLMCSRSDRLSIRRRKGQSHEKNT